MATSREMEGTPAEATWAMMTVIIIIVVVVIFCCLIPFYKALEKRWHHWDDLANDPRWDAENFQFSPTSPQLIRDPKYNRLSVCSTDNSSSVGTSSSGINRGNSFRNTCILPRFPDQVEFKLPPSYDDLFSKGTVEEDSGTPPPYSLSNGDADKEELIKDSKESSQSPVKPHVKKFLKKPQQKPSPLASSPPVATHTPTTKEQIHSVSATPKNTQNLSPPSTAGQDKPVTGPAPVKAPLRSATKTGPSTLNPPKTVVKKTTTVQPPVPPAKKTTSKFITKPGAVSTPKAASVQPTSEAPPPPPTAPAKKTYKKIKKTIPSNETTKSD